MHLYNFDPSTSYISATQANNYLSEVRSFRREANSLGYSGVPIWITEMGFVGEAEPLTQSQSSQISRVLSQLAANASALGLQRLFLFTDNTHAVTAVDRLDPLFAPKASASPSRPMPLTDYGQLVARLANGGRSPSGDGSSGSAGERRLNGTYERTVSSSVLDGGLEGLWKIDFNHGGYAVIFGGKVVIRGKNTVSGDRITFTDTSGPDRCLGTGTYIYKLGRSTLNFTKVKETNSCSGRAIVLSGTVDEVS
jgi:hypothetical protein